MAGAPYSENSSQRQFVSWIRNILISLGVYWLSLWATPEAGWPLDRLAGRIIYYHRSLSPLIVGAAISMGWVLAAILAGVIITLVIPGRRSQFWAFLLAALYVFNYRMGAYWLVRPSTPWDHLWLRAEQILPAVACVVAAFVTAYVRGRGQAKSPSRAAPGPVRTDN